ncbi:MAG: nitronate monooxygenase, partial [Patescibacteria group bacterium]
YCTEKPHRNVGFFVQQSRVQVEGSKDGFVVMDFVLSKFFGTKLPKMKRPSFLPIVSSHALAELLLKRATGDIEGFVVETPVAGGHNAPPRGKAVLNLKDEPVYGPRDEVDFGKLRALDKPFWIGGAYASPDGLALAQSQGAVGIQVGSIFALCEESGMEQSFRSRMRSLGYQGRLSIRTDRHASPTGFPFKVVELVGTISDPSVYELRQRVCDLSALATPYTCPDGGIGYRCASESIPLFIRKGGKELATVGSRCLCNGLLSAIGLGNPGELPIFTLGDDTSFLRSLMKDEDGSYTAVDVLAYLQKEVLK